MYALITAEVHRIKGEYAKAQDTYDIAIEKARSVGSINVVGVANELAMKFYMSRKMERAAKVLYVVCCVMHNANVLAVILSRGKICLLFLGCIREDQAIRVQVR